MQKKPALLVALYFGEPRKGWGSSQRPIPSEEITESPGFRDF